MAQTETNKKPRFALLDFIIILVVIAGIAGALARNGVIGRLFQGNESEDVKIAYTVENITGAQASQIKDGTAVYLDGIQLGNLISAQTGQYESYKQSSSGELITAVTENFTVSGEISATLSKTANDGYRFNKEFIGAGSERTVRIGNAEVKITVLSVTADEKTP